MKSLLSSTDIYVGVILIIILYIICFLRRSQKYYNSEIYKYFIPAWTVRVIGTIFSVMLYDFYYNAGDTFTYAKCSSVIFDTFWRDPFTALEIIWWKSDDLSLFTWNYLWGEVQSMYYVKFFSSSTSYPVRFGGFLSLFIFNSYFAKALIFSFISFVGSWRMYKSFYYIYPSLYKELAMVILFVPTVVFWGSGYLKDPLVMGALGFLTHASYMLFIKKSDILKNLFIVLLSSYFIIGIKVYIMISFLPALIFWLLLRQRDQISSTLVKRLLLPLVLVLIVGLGYLSLTLVGKYDSRYSLDGVLNTAIITQNYIKKTNKRKGGTGYDLGELQPTVKSAVAFFPKGVNVTLFRPYLWEARNPVLMITALESLATLLFSIYILLHVGFLRTIKILFTSPEVLFTITFAIFFAGAVGISTYNFGSLARYKAPCIPFYFTGLILILHLSGKKFHKWSND